MCIEALLINTRDRQRLRRVPCPTSWAIAGRSRPRFDGAMSRLTCRTAGLPVADTRPMKYVTDRPFAEPEAAARKLLDIVRASIAESRLPHAYTGATNTAFLRAGGSVEEYTAGQNFGAAQKWLQIDRSGTRIALLPDGAE